MRISTFAVPLVWIVLHSAAAAAAGPSLPPAPGPKERCPVCGMFVGRDRSWLAAIAFKDGTSAFFDGPKDLFRYAAEPGRYTKGRSAPDLKAVYVTEYYSARLTPAEGLYYVVGSDVLGPMGRELVPVAGKEQSETFRVDHQGKRILRFRDATLEELGRLE